MMQKILGSNLVQMKYHNQALVLKLICTNPPMSRSQLASASGLTKMTLSNIISGLTESGMIMETASSAGPAAHSVGRKPIYLDISDASPCVCGMLVKRGLLQVILADLRARILDRIDIRYESVKRPESLTGMLLDAYRKLKERNVRTIAAVSVSSLGPVDVSRGVLLNMPNFYGLSNIEIVRTIHEATGLPTFLINDASAGALAEKTYGCAKNLSNFVYLHFKSGIGAGAVLNDRLYEGDLGQSFEFGHTSISFSGPKCSCGNTGCLELYANTERMKEQTRTLAHLYPDSMLLKTKESLSWNDYVACAERHDPLAQIVLDRFCEYVSYALTSLLNLLDVNHVVIGYDGGTGCSFIEDAIAGRVNRSVLFAGYRPIEVRHSYFGGDGPLIGSIAAVASRVFNCGINAGENGELFHRFCLQSSSEKQNT